MAKKKRARQSDSDLTSAHYGSAIQLDANGHVPNGYTISFDDFDDGQPYRRDEQEVDDGNKYRGGPGSQVLPVALDIAEDFQGEPDNGDEYLFLVRREAAAHPNIVVAEAFVRAQIQVATAPTVPLLEPGPSHQPSIEWRADFLSRFTNMRETFATAAGPSTSKYPVPAHYLPIPAAADDSSWKSYINGRKKRGVPQQAPSSSPKGKERAMDPVDGAAAAAAANDPADDPSLTESAESDEAAIALAKLKSEPKSPIPVVLQRLEQHTVISLLDHYNGWLEDRIEMYEESKRIQVPSTIFLPASMRKKPARAKAPAGAPATSSTNSSSGNGQLPTPPPSSAAPPAVELDPILTPLDSQWLLSLFTVLDKLLISKQVGILRTLARTCLDVADLVHSQSQLPGLSSEQMEQAETAIAGCWMVVAAVWEVWGQRDLWM